MLNNGIDHAISSPITTLTAAADAEIRLYTGVDDSQRLCVPNHGFVRHDQIEDYYSDPQRQIFLACITLFQNCCSREFSAGQKEIGWWFFPNGTEIPKVEQPLRWSFYTSRHDKIVFLYRRGETDRDGGIHRCDIPVSADANETLYVGLYPNGGGYNRCRAYMNITNYLVSINDHYICLTYEATIHKPRMKSTWYSTT